MNYTKGKSIAGYVRLACRKAAPLLPLVCTVFGLQAAASGQEASAPPLLASTSSQDRAGHDGNPVVHLQAADLRQFNTAFSALSEQGKVAFVAEGKPFVPRLSDEDFTKLTKSLPVGSAATLREVTDQVARAFDYDAVRVPSEPGLVLLLKRYSDPKDFPMVSYEEAVRSLKNILLATNTLNPRTPFIGKPGSPFNRLYASLSAEQRVKIVNPTAVSDLSPEQQRIVWQLACQTYFEPLESFDNVYRRLNGLGDPQTVFCWMDWTKWMDSPFPLFVFGWEGPFGPNHGNHKVAISHNLHTGPGGATGLSVSYKEAIASGLIDEKTGRLLKPLPDEVIAPDAVDTATAAPGAELGTNTLTLQEAVEQLNKKAAAPPENAASSTPKTNDIFHASVDEAIAHKTVTLIGAKNTPPFVLLDALSRVYGLRLGPQKDNTIFLTLRSPRPCKQFADVPQELRRLFPEPIWRAVESGAQRYENSDEEQAIKKREEAMRSHLSEAQIKASARHYEVLAKQGHIRMRLRSAEALNVEAIRRLRILVQPQVPKNSGKRLPVVEVSEEAHQALAIIHLTQAAEALDGLFTNPVPPYLLHFEHAWVQAIVGTPAGPNAAACHLGTFEEEGIAQSSSSVFFQMTPQ